jgi:HEAT repeat protein
MLTAIELKRSAAKRIQQLGNEAVTALCEIALGMHPGLKPKVRTNATALLDSVDHPQARETLQLLVTDDNPDVRIRALRGVGRARFDGATPQLAAMLRRPETQPLIAAEAVKALAAIDSAPARAALSAYQDTRDPALLHRHSTTVMSVLDRLQTTR